MIVIGGGLAGLSSAVALADAGFHVRLLEQRPFLGGRASSYVLPTGEHIDNCQHVTLGCCVNLDDFYRRIGASQKIAFYERLTFIDRDGRRSSMETSALPPPLHLAPSLVLYSSLPWKERWAISRAMLAIARQGGRNANADAAGRSMLDWLRLHGQTPAAIARFWSVILVSALNEELHRMDARYALDVFWKAFLSNRSGYRVGIPRVPLGELYAGCRVAIERQSGEVTLSARVHSLRVADGRVVAVETSVAPRLPARSVRAEENVGARRVKNDQEVTGDFYVLAVPHQAALDLLPADLAEREPLFHNLRELRCTPITGVHLWFDRDVMAEPFLTLLDRTTQWIFNKSRLCGSPGEGRYLQLVISASYALVARPRQEIIDLCLRELTEVLPEARKASLVRAMVIKEMAATFSPAPGSDRWRPAQRSPLPNLFLAGDWTATGWPATMEGAVRSGYLAAEAVLAAAGTPRQLVRTDLPAEGLARYWQSGRSMS